MIRVHVSRRGSFTRRPLKGRARFLCQRAPGESPHPLTHAGPQSKRQLDAEGRCPRACHTSLLSPRLAQLASALPQEATPRHSRRVGRGPAPRGARRVPNRWEQTRPPARPVDSSRRRWGKARELESRCAAPSPASPAPTTSTRGRAPPAASMPRNSAAPAASWSRLFRPGPSPPPAPPQSSAHVMRGTERGAARGGGRAIPLAQHRPAGTQLGHAWCPGGVRPSACSLLPRACDSTHSSSHSPLLGPDLSSDRGRTNVMSV